jgi:hypothetical protein
VSAKQIMTTELKEQKFRRWNKLRLYGEQNFNPRKKSWIEKLEQKYSISRTNRDSIRNKNLGRGTNQA